MPVTRWSGSARWIAHVHVGQRWHGNFAEVYRIVEVSGITAIVEHEKTQARFRESIEAIESHWVLLMNPIPVVF